MTTHSFDNSQDVVHLGKWSIPRRNCSRHQYPRSQLLEIIDICEARPDLGGLPAVKLSDRWQVAKDNLCFAACLRVARACIILKIPFCLANPVGSYLWKLSGL